MTNNNHTLRFFGLFFGIFLMLAVGACKKENDVNPKDEYLSNGSFAELEFKGKKYKIDGFGLAMSIDTVFVIENQTFAVNQLIGAINAMKWVEDPQLPNPVLFPEKTFSFNIINYKGKGKYGNPDYSNSESSGVISFIYAETPTETQKSFSIHKSKKEEDKVEIDIKVDNDKEMSGTFSFMGYSEVGAETSPCTGKFKIVKQ